MNSTLYNFSRQPLFQLMGALIVLLLTDMRPVYGGVALVVWMLWVSWATGAFLTHK
jgi:hypothetical protein